MHGASYDDVVEAEDDELEAALRREGYRLSRRELDALMEEREYAKFKTYVERYAAEVGAQPALGADEEDDEADDGGKAKSSPLPRKTAKKPAKTPSANGSPDDEDEADWV